MKRPAGNPKVIAGDPAHQSHAVYGRYRRLKNLQREKPTWKQRRVLNAIKSHPHIEMNEIQHEVFHTCPLWFLAFIWIKEKNSWNPAMIDLENNNHTPAYRLRVQRKQEYCDFKRIPLLFINMEQDVDGQIMAFVMRVRRDNATLGPAK